MRGSVDRAPSLSLSSNHPTPSLSKNVSLLYFLFFFSHAEHAPHSLTPPPSITDESKGEGGRRERRESRAEEGVHIIHINKPGRPAGTLPRVRGVLLGKVLHMGTTNSHQYIHAWFQNQFFGFRHTCQNPNQSMLWDLPELSLLLLAQFSSAKPCQLNISHTFSRPCRGNNNGVGDEKV